MSAQVQTLANLMKSKREVGQKFVLLLGAGASMGSGVKSTSQIMQELLDKYGPDIEGPTLEDRFDKLWARTSNDSRDMFLEEYLEVEPSPGYTKLAALIRAEYFDVVLTFNFDNLLEQALHKIGFTDYKVIIRGETQDDQMEKLTEIKKPRFKIAKLHGSVRSANHFRFEITELLQYPEPIDSLVRKLTSSDIIVCGYAFNDDCVQRAFSNQGGNIVCVNPAGAPRKLNVFLKNRRSEGWEMRTDFETFVDELHRELLEPRSTQPKPLLNPFKFLESYEEADCGSLMRREEETEWFFHALAQDPPPQILVLSGPGRAGKTSLVKAALLPTLDDQKYQALYLRCQRPPTNESSGPLDLSLRASDSVKLDLASRLQQLSQTAGNRRIVVFLDQFERVIGRNSSTTTGRKELSTFLQEQLFKYCDPKLTLVLVVADEGQLGAQLMQESQRQRIPALVTLCPAFDRVAVLEIIEALAKKGEIAFDQRIVDHLLDRYEQSRQGSTVEKRFTLAHIQAVCHILSSARQVDYLTYEQAFTRTQDALNQAINVCDIISFVEDFDWSEAAWLRNIIKVPLKESLERIAKFITTNSADLMPTPRPKGRPRAPADPGAVEVSV